MRKNKLSLILIILCLAWQSCTDSVEKDAKEAADLMKKSEEAAVNYNLELSDSFFKEYKEIESRYTNSEKKEEFEKSYWAYIKDSKPNL